MKNFKAYFLKNTIHLTRNLIILMIYYIVAYFICVFTTGEKDINNWTELQRWGYAIVGLLLFIASVMSVYVIYEYKDMKAMRKVK